MLRRTRAALAFYEEAAGLTYAQRVSKCQWFNRQADALESTLTTTQKGQAWQTHSAYVAASEALVVNEQAAIVLRCYAFWRCLESWGALRFSDHRGLSPTECTVTEEAFKGVLVRTKTTGREKKVPKRVLHIDRKCWLLHPEWMSVGWKLWQENAPCANKVSRPLGEIRVQVRRSDCSLPGAGDRTGVERRKIALSRCSREIVA